METGKAAAAQIRQQLVWVTFRLQPSVWLALLQVCLRGSKNIPSVSPYLWGCKIRRFPVALRCCEIN